MRIIKLINSIVVPSMLILISVIFWCGKTMEDNFEKIMEPAMSHRVDAAKVDRVEVLEKFLNKYNSPLAINAKTFVDVADRYGMDYRLLPAISCMESTCGQKLIPGSYNAWGWGIYGNNVIRFNNFDEGIETVGKGLYEGYIKHGLDTPSKIAPIYTPPMSNHWLKGVTFFMNQIDDVSMAQVEG